MVDDQTRANADTEASETTDATEAAAGREPARTPRWSVLPWLIAAVAVLVAAATTSLWLSLRADAATRADVHRTAERFMLALTTWDASDGLGDTRDELRAAGTGDFLTEVDELFGGSLGQQLEEVDAVSTGDVQDVFVQRIQDDEALALGVVVQELTTDLAEQPERTVRSARLTLVHDGDRWLVSNVQLLVDDVTDIPGEAEDTSDGTDAGEEDAP